MLGSNLWDAMGQAEEEELRRRQINPPERHPGWSQSLGREWYRYGFLQMATAWVVEHPTLSDFDFVTVLTSWLTSCYSLELRRSSFVRSCGNVKPNSAATVRLERRFCFLTERYSTRFESFLHS